MPCPVNGGKKEGEPELSALTVPEMRRLLLLAREAPERQHFHLWWSRFRRRHQAQAQRCHTARRAHEHRTSRDPATIVALASTTPELDDARWEEVAGLLPAIRRHGEEPALDGRTILEGILWVARTGSSWRDLPTRFGYWETIRDYYHRWKQHGHWQRIRTALQATVPTPPSEVSL